MADRSKIEWTDATWSPVTGCTKVSAGCARCYAESIAKRFWGKRSFSDVRCHPERLEQPLRWRKPRRIFVNSMSDLWHEDVPDEFIAAVFGVMAACPQHTFVVLTKRAGRMWKWFSWFAGWRDHKRFLQPSLIEHAGATANRSEALYAAANAVAGRDTWPLPNVWLLVSGEDQKTADERIPLLLQTPAAVRGVSYEPGLAAVYFEYEWLMGSDALSWIVCGAESGPKARPMKLDWVRSVRNQCNAAGAAFFLKQIHVNGKLVKMPELDGKVWDQFPVVR